MTAITKMVGKTLSEVRRVGDEELLFLCEDGSEYRMWHLQDCCECVSIEDVSGDLDDLIGVPILVAEERESNEPPEGASSWDESNTWTFYTIRTIKGTVDIR